MNEETPKPNNDEAPALEDAEQAHLNLERPLLARPRSWQRRSEASSGQLEVTEDDFNNEEAFDEHDDPFSRVCKGAGERLEGF